MKTASLLSLLALVAAREADRSPDPDLGGSYWELGVARLRLGDEVRGDSLLRLSLDLIRGSASEAEAGPGYAYTRARTHAVMGEVEAAREWFERAVDGGYLDPWLLRDPALDPIRDDPVYLAAAERARQAASLNR